MAKFTDSVITEITADSVKMARELRSAASAIDAQRERERAAVKQAEAMAKERADVEAQIRDGSLRAAGRHLEADVAQVRAAYAQRIAAAKAAGQRELADRLTLLQRMKEAEIRNAQETAAARAKAAQQGQIGGRTQQAIQLLAGGGAAAGSVMLARRAEAFGDKLNELRDQLAAGKITAADFRVELAKSIPVIGDWLKAGVALRGAIDGTARMERELSEQFRARRARLDAENASNVQLRQQAGTLADQRFLAEARTDGERQRRQIELEFKRAMEAVAKQEADGGFAPGQSDAANVTRAELTRKRLRELEDINAAEAGAEEERRQAEIKHEKEVAAERAKANADAEFDIAQMRRRLSGQDHEAELADIRKRRDEAIAAARAVGDAKAEQLAKDRAQLEEQALAAQRQRDQLIKARQADIGKFQDEAKALRKQIDLAESRNQAPPIVQADQNRFLTGVRQQTQQEDRARMAEEQRRIDLLKAQADKLDDAVDELRKIVEQLSNAPILVVEEE